MQPKPLNGPTPRRHRGGFTLVELLVVTGIIAVLISILIPVLGRARALAQRSQCLSQMQQVGIALVAYMAESKGYVPVQPGDVDDFGNPTILDINDGAYRSVLGTLLHYMTKERRVLRCPTASEFSWWGVEPKLDSDTNYMVNHSVVGRRMTRIRQSSDVIFFQEDRYRWSIAWCRPAGAPPVNGRPTYLYWTFPNAAPFGQEYSITHDKGGNLLFCDGHAEWRLSAALRAADFGLTGGPGLTGSPTDTTATPAVLYNTYFSIFD